jgi:hypothetical protein
MTREEIVGTMARVIQDCRRQEVFAYQTAEAALAAIEARGLCIVPREATLKMQNAAVDATGLHYTAPDHTGWRRSPQMLFEAGWTAMIAASEGTK